MLDYKHVFCYYGLKKNVSLIKGGDYNMERLFQGDLMALSPEYVDSKGNCTLVYMKNTEPFVIERTIRSVIKIIAKHYMLDLKELKKRYKALISSQNLIPIPLSKNDIFIPFKTRVPICKNDGALSYVNMRYIRGIKDNSEYRIINLNNEINIKCLSSLSSMENHIRNGNIICRCYEDSFMKVSEDEEYYSIMIPAKMFKLINTKN